MAKEFIASLTFFIASDTASFVASGLFKTTFAASTDSFNTFNVTSVYSVSLFIKLFALSIIERNSSILTKSVIEVTKLSLALSISS